MSSGKRLTIALVAASIAAPAALSLTGAIYALFFAKAGSGGHPAAYPLFVVFFAPFFAVPIIPGSLLIHGMLWTLGAKNLLFYLLGGAGVGSLIAYSQMEGYQPTEMGRRNPGWDGCTPWIWEDIIFLGMIPGIAAMLAFWLVWRPGKGPFD